MKKLFLLTALASIGLLISSCHREGCPGKITQSNSQTPAC